MASLVNHSVTNLINGVSQQATSVRLDNQLEEQVNCFSDVTKGLTIRNGLELQNVVDVELADRIKLEFTVDGQRYLLGMNIDDVTPLVHVPLTADVETLSASIDTSEYFRGATQSDIRVVEDKDKVYILNKKTVVGTNESNTAYYDVKIKSDSSGLPAADWTSGSYRITIASVADDASGVTPSEPDVVIDVDSSMSPYDVLTDIQATTIENEVGTVSVTGNKGAYRLIFSDIPKEFTTPDVTITTLVSISGSSSFTVYEPNDGTYWERKAGDIYGGFHFSPQNQISYFTVTDTTYVDFADSEFGSSEELNFNVSGNQSVIQGPDGRTYYRGNLVQTRDVLSTTGPSGTSYDYSVRREATTTTSDSYTASISTPTELTGEVYSADKFADEGMIWVTGVAAAQSYNVTIKYEDTAGTPYTFSIATVNVGATASNIKLNWVADQIRAAIDASTHFSSSTSDIYNNAVHFYSTVEAAYSITSIEVDNNFDTSSINAVTRATISNDTGITNTDNLPPVFKDGFKIRIGDDALEGSNYYLIYDSAFQGWKEVGLDESRSLDAVTMPYIIDKEKVRKENSITIEPAAWARAFSGDRESNKSPSFVDRSVNDIFFYGSRLGLATDDTLVLSSIDAPTEFFRTTCSRVLTSDRVDILLDSSKIGFSAITSVASYDSKLMVNTSTSQSVLLVNSSFDLTTARLSEVSSYTLGNHEPLPVNNGLYFALSNNNKTNVFNYITSGNSNYQALNLTKHIPTYIKGNIVRMAYADNLMILATDNDKKNLYAQNAYSSGGELLQNSWHRWELPYDIEYFTFIDNNLYVYMTAIDSLDNVKTFVSRYDLTPQVVEESTEDAYIGWIPYLDIYTKDKTLVEDFSEFIGIDDRYGTIYDSVTTAYDSTRVDQEDLGTEDGPYYSSVSPVYYWKVEGNTNTLVFNDGTPIITGNTSVEYLDYGGYRYFRGEESEDSGFYEVSRSAITTSFFYKNDIVYGVPFKASVELSEIIPRIQNQDGSYTVMNYATLMLRRMRLFLGNTGVFSVNIAFKDRQNYTVKYTGQPLGKILLGRNSVSDINFKFPINGKSDRVTITISTDSSSPFNLLSAEWQGRLTQRGRNI